LTVQYAAGGAPSLWMGLGQVRDLRRASQKGIVHAREEHPFADLRDLLRRVELQPKEVTHLIQCGALDGLGEHRAALLAEAGEVARAGSARQLALFATGGPALPPETPAERLACEHKLLGLPVSVQPVDLLGLVPAGILTVRALPDSRGQRVTVRAQRLPGWTGGQGVFIGDGESYVIARLPRGQKGLAVWHAGLWTGRWRTDQWGGGGVEVESVKEEG
jgi:DNA polymerase III alpha subunit